MSDSPYTVTDTGGWRGDGNVHTVVSADYHRNGVGGAGFVVALVDTTFPGEEPRRFLLTWFPTYDDEGDERVTGHCETVAVVALDEAVKGNIGMFPQTDPQTGEPIPGTGGNAWRGADNWAIVLPVIKRWQEDERKASQERLRLNQEARIGRQV